MICEDLRHIIYEMDQNEELPAAAREHIAHCPECRRQLELSREAEAAATLPEESDSLLTDRIMERICEPAEERGVGVLAVWILGGLTLLGAAVLVRYSLTFHYLLESHLGGLVDLGVTVALGLFLVSYLAAFILGNADRLGSFHEMK